MNNKKTYRILIIVLMIIGLLCAVWVGTYMYQRFTEKAALEQLQEEVKVETTETPVSAEGEGAGRGSQTAESSTAPSGQEETEIFAEPYVDFTQLQQRNSEIYGWIVIPDTRVDYPIVQREGSDQGYYLNHDIDGNYSVSGSIYTENLNKKDFTDPNTLIYGHNMRNGTMFQDLHKFQEEEFFNLHPEFYIYTPEKKFTYEIFSAYEYDNRHILRSFDFSDREEYARYLESALNPRSVNKMTREGVEVTPDDRIVTLSTCIGKDTSRYLVQGVLIKEETVASSFDRNALESEDSADREDSARESPEDLSSEETLN